jgi:hypothetical protein
VVILATGHPAFDVTPADLITGIITERGVQAGGIGGPVSVTALPPIQPHIQTCKPSSSRL